MNFDIGIFYQDDMPEDWIINLAQELQEANVRVEIESRKNEPFISLEWAIPAAIILFLARPYIDGLLKEAAKEHYPIIKRSLSTFAQKVLGLKQQTIVSSNAPNKVQKDNPVSSLFGIWSVTIDGRSLKFLFYRDKDEDYYAVCIDEVFQALLHHTQAYPNDYISNQAGTIRQNQREIYLLFDDSVKKWKVVDIVTGKFAGE